MRLTILDAEAVRGRLGRPAVDGGDGALISGVTADIVTCNKICDLRRVP